MSSEKCLPNGIPYGSHFYMARHGETTDNVLDVASGRGRNPDLTELGGLQARGLQSTLTKLEPPITCVVTSSLKRAIDTGNLACDNDFLRRLEHHSEAGLDESHHGAGEGVSNDEFKAYRKQKGVYAGAESHDGHRNRVVESIAKILNINDDITPLFVSHFATMRRFLEAVFPNRTDLNKLDDFEKIPNCTVYEFIAPKNERGEWKVNVISLDENKEITRRPFGKTQSIADNLAVKGIGSIVR